jgi:adenosylcobinamide-GDP ribazoletransferase
LLNDLKIATVFLTRLPVRVAGRLAMRDLAGAVHLFPLVGALVGLLGAAAFALGQALGLPPFPCAILAVAATALATGALHEDGLADTADGLGAGADRARALEIMRDSRIGSFGAVALVLTLLARISALAAMGGQPALVAGALVAAGAASRATMPAVMYLQPSARASGLAAEAGKPDPARVAAAVASALAAAFLLLPPAAAAAATLGAVAVSALAAAALGRRLGGCTGDTLGAVQQLAEVAFLLGVVTRL